MTDLKAEQVSVRVVNAAADPSIRADQVSVRVVSADDPSIRAEQVSLRVVSAPPAPAIRVEQFALRLVSTIADYEAPPEPGLSGGYMDGVRAGAQLAVRAPALN